jgi:hypothetical protein
MRQVTATNSEEAASIGHNMPPEPTLRERIEETYAAQFAEVETLAVKANALPKVIATDDDVGKVADVAAETRKAAANLDRLRKVEKEPHLRDAETVDAVFNEARIKRLKKITDGLSERITTYNRAKAAQAREEQAKREREARDAEEKARLDAAMEAEAGNYTAVADHVEQAHQAAAQAEQAAAPVKAADATRMRSAGGTTVSTRTVVKARVIDWETVDLNKLRPFIKHEHVEAALGRFVAINKKAVPIAGVEFYDDETAIIRS